MCIVVDNDDISKVLLNRKCFDFFVIFLNLNKVSYPRIPEDRIAEARSIAKLCDSKLYLPNSPEIAKAIDPKYTEALNYATAGFVIVDNIEAASAICEKVGLRTVTTDGDIFDPSGQVFGGYMAANQSIFFKYSKYLELKKDYDNAMSKNTSKAELTELLTSMLAKKEDYFKQKAYLASLTEKYEKLKTRAHEFRLQGNPVQIKEDQNRLDMYRGKLKRTEEEMAKLRAEISSDKELVGKIKKGGDAKGMLGARVKQLEEEEKALDRSHKEHLAKKSEAEASIDNCIREKKELADKIALEDAEIVRVKEAAAERTKYFAAEQAELEAIEVVLLLTIERYNRSQRQT